MQCHQFVLSFKDSLHPMYPSKLQTAQGSSQKLNPMLPYRVHLVGQRTQIPANVLNTSCLMSQNTASHLGEVLINSEILWTVAPVFLRLLLFLTASWAYQPQGMPIAISKYSLSFLLLQSVATFQCFSTWGVIIPGGRRGVWGTGYW